MSANVARLYAVCRLREQTNLFDLRKAGKATVKKKDYNGI